MIRKRLPDTRSGTTKKLEVAGLDLYLTVNFYENDQPGEIFVTIGKEGSTLSGLVDSLATSLSLMLQTGIPLERAVAKLKDSRYEPSCEQFSSISDAIAKGALGIVSTWGGQAELDYDGKETEW